MHPPVCTSSVIQNKKKKNESWSYNYTSKQTTNNSTDDSHSSSFIPNSQGSMDKPNANIVRGKRARKTSI